MLTIAELRGIARARLEDARVLFDCASYDGAVYVCGYAVEMALKARICETLGWEGYPSTSGGFREYQTFRTHDLDVLLRLSGAENAILTASLTEWSVVARWDPEIRYNPIGTASEDAARTFIESTAQLMSRIRGR